MPIWEFSERDLLRGKVVDPGWYDVRVDAIGEIPAKDQGSINWPVEGTIIRNADTGSTEFAGVPIGGIGEWSFNSKWMKPAETFLQCFGVKVEVGKRFDPDAAIGKVITVFIENATWEGRVRNRVNHKYRPAKTESV